MICPIYNSTNFPKQESADQEATEDNKYYHSSPFIPSSPFLSHWEET